MNCINTGHDMRALDTLVEVCDLVCNKDQPWWPSMSKQMQKTILKKYK
jgi:hypothetical protein